MPQRRVRPSFAMRLGRAFRSWARDTFSRDQLISGFKSLAWVAPMTILIWVYAEREQTTKGRMTFRVEARNTDPNRLVTLGVGPDGRPRTEIEVYADVSGPQARFQEVREKLEAAGAALQEDVPALEPGSHSIALGNLTNDPLFVSHGLSISNISPPEMRVTIDPIDHVDLEVMVKPTVTNLDGPAVFDPPVVHVAAPRSALEAARQQGRLLAYADLGNLTDPGTRTLSDVHVSVLANEPRVTISPTTVSAKLTVKKSDEEGTIRSLPVWVIYPPSAFWDKYKAEYEKNLDDVKVTGPAEMLREINDPAFEPKPKAYFDVTTATQGVGPNAAGTRHEATLHFDFGNTGLKISPDDTHKTIMFNIVERRSGD